MEVSEMEDEPWVNPVCDSVVEKVISGPVGGGAVAATAGGQQDATESKPKLSKFKAMRSQR
jgi:hypothetical protein